MFTLSCPYAAIRRASSYKLWRSGDRSLCDSSLQWSLFSKSESLDEALCSVEALVSKGVHLSTRSLYIFLKECTKRKDQEAGKKIKNLMIKSGLETNLFLANHLIRLFSTCGALIEAVEVFGKLPRKDCHVWTSMIVAYSKHGQNEDSIKLYHEMRESVEKPDVHTYVAVLNACAKISTLTQGCLVHAHILQNGLDSNVYLNNSLINMYSKCRSLIEAKHTFDKMSSRDTITWNTMISGCAQNGDIQGAFDLYIRMQREGFKPDRVTFLSILKACGSQLGLVQGKLIHERIITDGLEFDPFIGSALIDMYAKCGLLEYARELFHKLPKHSMVSYNAMIGGCVHHGFLQEAFHLFEKMQKEGQKLDKVTYLYMLKACGGIGSLEGGRQIHALLDRSGLGWDKFVGSALIDMYGKCGSTDKAWEVFSRLHGTDLILWNTMIKVFAEHGSGHDALQLFQTMQREGPQPDRVTFVGVLKACGQAEDIAEGRKVHKQVICAGLATDLFISNTLIDMYCKCGSLDEAYSIFLQLRSRDIVSYNVMIAGYVKHQRDQKALRLFKQLKLEGLSPNESTFISMLKIYGNLSDLENGKLLHAQISESGLESDVFVGSALVDMYAKCARPNDAKKIFFKLSKRDVVAWTTVISGYAEQGEGREALNLLEKMKEQGLKPTKVTYLSVLKACGHLADLHQGRIIHADLLKQGLKIDNFIGSALIDMYVKCGSLEEAHKIFLILPQHDTVLWNSLFSGYALHGQGKDALRLFKKMREQGVKPDEATYRCIFSACSQAGMGDEGYWRLRQIDAECLKGSC